MFYSEYFDTQRAATDEAARLIGAAQLRLALIVGRKVGEPTSLSITHAIDSIHLHGEKDDIGPIMDLVRSGWLRFASKPQGLLPTAYALDRLAARFEFSAAPGLNSEELRNAAVKLLKERQGYDIGKTGDRAVDRWLFNLVQLDSAVQECARLHPDRVHEGLGERTLWAHTLKNLRHARQPGVFPKDLFRPDERDRFDDLCRRIDNAPEEVRNNRSRLYDLCGIKSTGNPPPEFWIKDRVIDAAYVRSVAEELGSVCSLDIIDAGQVTRFPDDTEPTSISFERLKSGAQQIDWRQVSTLLQKKDDEFTSESEELLARGSMLVRAGKSEFTGKVIEAGGSELIAPATATHAASFFLAKGTAMLFDFLKPVILSLAKAPVGSGLKWLVNWALEKETRRTKRAQSIRLTALVDKIQRAKKPLLTSG